jgi:hypothetical protein
MGGGWDMSMLESGWQFGGMEEVREFENTMKEMR